MSKKKYLAIYGEPGRESLRMFDDGDFRLNGSAKIVCACRYKRNAHDVAGKKYRAIGIAISETPDKKEYHVFSDRSVSEA